MITGLCHERTNPVYVIGGARSGTSILCTLLRDEAGIAFGTESQFILRYHDRLRRYGDLSDRRNLARLVSDLSRERCFRRWGKFGFRFDAARTLRNASEASYASVLRAIFEHLAEHMSMARWGDKTPEYNTRLGVIHSLFPDAQFVHIARDGRDVALSMQQTHFGAKNVYRAARDWSATLDAIASFTAALPSDCCHHMRYEDLLERPAIEWARLMRFLGVRDTAADGYAASAEAVTARLDRNNAGKSRSALSREERRVFDAVAADALEQWGYDVLEPRPAPLHSWEHLYWQVHHHARKLTRLDSWRDTFYRASVRFG